MTLLIDEIESLQQVMSLDIETLYLIDTNLNGRLFLINDDHPTYVLALYFESSIKFCVLVSKPIHWEILAEAERSKRISNLVYLSIDLIRGIKS